MSVYTSTFEVSTTGKGTYSITDEINQVVTDSKISAGTVTVFVKHTSASLVIMENADYSAREDLHAFFDHLVPEDTPYFVHTYEGPDDMPSHIRMCLTRTSEVIPVIDNQATLGTWQGVFLFEHRNAPHTRQIVISVIGE